MAQDQAIIAMDDAPTLAAAFRERVERTPDTPAYIQYEDGRGWHTYTWRDTAFAVARWQRGLRRCDLAPGDRVAIMCRNSWEWVCCDQAAHGLGLVVVPIYTNDHAGNTSWILEHSEAEFLFLEQGEFWTRLTPYRDRLAALKTVVFLEGDRVEAPLVRLDDWLPDGDELVELAHEENGADDLATIVYTSGTTGRPKGVMLSHRNILWNIQAALGLYPIYPDDNFLSFLPLSHSFERTVGYYLPLVAGSSVTYNRSIAQLGDDLQQVKPTLMISVPRIFERVYARITDKVAGESPLKQWLFHTAVRLGWDRFQHEQGRASWHLGLLFQPLLDRLVGSKIRERLGGRMRFTVCGGAKLEPAIAKLFIGLGIPVLQGYGLTETSPVIAANTIEDNLPHTIGKAFPGVEVKIGEYNELLTRSPSVMLGYWRNAEATAEIMDAEGWLHTGDVVDIDAEGHISITGRLKEIIVLANGEKIAPTDVENAIALDGLIDQVLVVGEGKPYLTALVVPNPEAYAAVLEELHLNAQQEEAVANPRLLEIFMDHVKKHLKRFPGYVKIPKLAVVREAWTPENGLATPTLKLRRKRILERYQSQVDMLYSGH